MAAYHGGIPQAEKSAEKRDVAACDRVSRIFVVGCVYRMAGLVGGLCDPSGDAGKHVVHGYYISGRKDGGVGIPFLSDPGRGVRFDPVCTSGGRSRIGAISVRYMFRSQSAVPAGACAFQMERFYQGNAEEIPRLRAGLIQARPAHLPILLPPNQSHTGHDLRSRERRWT